MARRAIVRLENVLQLNLIVWSMPMAINPNTQINRDSNVLNQTGGGS